MGINRSPSWGTLTGKPTTVDGLGISNFNESAIAAMAGVTLGAVGSFAFLARSTNAAAVAGSTYAGSGLRYAGAARTDNSTQIITAGLNATAPAGTWRCLGEVSDTGGNSLHSYVASIFVRTV